MPKGNMDSRKGGQSNFGKGKTDGNAKVHSYREKIGPATGSTPSGKPKAESKAGNAKP